MTTQPIEPDETIGTQAQLTEDEKSLIDDAPDRTCKFLFDYVANHGIPEYFKLTLHGPDGELKKDLRFEGYPRVLAAMDYMEYLVDNGIRKDFRNE